MIFENDPFEILNRAFEILYPEKEYKACYEEKLEDETGKTVYGFTEFCDGEIPVIVISAELTIKDAIEIFAHELAHVAAGKEKGHGDKWKLEFEKIYTKYHEIGEMIFGEKKNE